MPARGSRPVLITGCSTGIGRATALRLARSSDLMVYATARRVETLADLERAGCRTMALDVTDEVSMRAGVERIEAEHGAVWGLVNNAGYSQSGPVEGVPIEDVRRQFETNVFGPVRLTQLVLPGMRGAGEGRIVNVSSMGAHFSFPGGGFYHATKAALNAISDALRFEVAGFGIEVVVIEPGLIRTRFAEAAVGAMEQATGDGDGPYAGFTRHVGAATAGVYEDGFASRLGGPPEAVAKVIARALAARRPRTRYSVTPSAHLMKLPARFLPDRLWDALMRTQFPQPK